MPRQTAIPFTPPVPAPPAAPPTPPPPTKGPLLGDKSTVFVLPPAGSTAAASGGDQELFAAAFAPLATPAPAAELNPQAAREEYEQGQSWLAKPYVSGAGWPAADRAVQHFQRAATLDHRNADYATRAGVACKLSIARFLESWGQGPMTSIAAFHIAGSLGKQIDKANQLFRPSGLSVENQQLVVQRANEAITWFGRALQIDPEDSVARCYRAELLRDVGAFGPALADAKAVLSSPLVPSATRDAAQKVADFVLSEDSPLRKFLTRSEAQSLPGPEGIALPTIGPDKRAAVPQPPVANFEDSFSKIVVQTGESRPLFAPVGSYDPTQAEMPMFAAPSTSAAAPPSVASRLKRRRQGAWKAAIVPVLLGLILVVGGTGYMYFSRPTFTGPLPGNDLGTETLRHTYYRNEFGLPDDRMGGLLALFQDEPETLRTQLRSMVISGSSRGLEIALRAGEKGKLVRVDLRSDPNLAEFCRQQAEKLQAPLLPLRTEVLKKFASDLDTARSAGMRMGNLGDYVDTLGGDLLVNGLGYHVAAVADGNEYGCIYEDQAGALYFLVPSHLSAFNVIERKFTEQSMFPRKFEYVITIQKPATPTPAVPPAEPATQPETPDAEPASETPAEATPGTSTTDAAQSGQNG